MNIMRTHHHGAMVRRSILFTKVLVGEHSVIEDSLVLPNVSVGRGVRLRRAIVDKHCVLPDGFSAGFSADYADGLNGHVRLLGNTVALHEYLPEAVGAFLVANPQVNVSVGQATGDEIVMALADGSTDVGVFSDEIKTYDLETFAFRQHRLVLVTPLNHPLALQAQRRHVSILEADACDVIGLPEGSALQQRWEARAAQRGVRLNYRVRVPSFDAQCRLIESGAGVALLPEATARRFAASMRVCVVPLTDAWLARQLVVAVQRIADLPAFTQRLVKHLAAEVVAPETPKAIKPLKPAASPPARRPGVKK